MISRNQLSENDLRLLENAALFRGVDRAEQGQLLASSCLRLETFAPGAVIFSNGERVSALGLVLIGRVQIEQIDYWGNRNLLNELGPGDIFGEAYAIGGDQPMDNDAVARSSARILFLEFRALLRRGENSTTTERILYNLLAISASRNRYLAGKVRHLSKRSTREKLLSYLSAQARLHGENEFDIPYDRQQLADYLAVERSAMSAELGRMKRDGLVEFRKSHFLLLRREP